MVDSFENDASSSAGAGAPTAGGAAARAQPSGRSAAVPQALYGTRQEALNRCSTHVVAMLKCVEEKQWAWHWSCMDQHAALQRCYLEHQQPPGWAESAVWKRVTRGFESARDWWNGEGGGGSGDGSRQ